MDGALALARQEEAPRNRSTSAAAIAASRASISPSTDKHRVRIIPNNSREGPPGAGWVRCAASSATPAGPPRLGRIRGLGRENEVLRRLPLPSGRRAGGGGRGSELGSVSALQGCRTCSAS
jgi:hypothetical protein